MRQKTVFSLLVLVLVLSALSALASLLSWKQTPAVWRSSQVSFCEGSKSYFKASSLYNYESRNFTANAKGYKVLGSDRSQLRVVFDYIARKDGSASNEYKAVITNQGADTLKVNRAKLILEASGSQVSFGSDQDSYRLDKDQSKTYTASSSIELSRGQKWSVNFSDGRRCIFRLEGFFENLAGQNETKVSGGVLLGSESGTVEVPPGLSPAGFADWRTTKPYIDAGLKVLSFNQEKSNSWQEIQTDPKSLFEPGVGYFIENPTSVVAKVRLEEPFSVPSNISTHSIRRGWNLIYNDTGKDVAARSFHVSILSAEFSRRTFKKKVWTIGELIDQKLVSENGFDVAKYQTNQSPQINGVDLNSANLTDGKAYWLYLYDEPDVESLVSNNLDLAVKLDKDSYKPGEKIRISLKVTNNSADKYLIDAENQDDPCLYGFAIMKGKEVINSTIPSGVASCPRWPEQTYLQPGSVIEYNQEWTVPEKISGEIKVVGYFDQSRIFSGDRKLKQVIINIEEK